MDELDRVTLVVAYLPQVAGLIVAIGMAWYVRRVYKRISYAMIVLFLFLIVRRVDDVFHILSQIQVLAISYVVVVSALFALIDACQRRSLLYMGRRRQEDALEAMRRLSEGDGIPWDKQAGLSMSRYQGRSGGDDQ